MNLQHIKPSLEPEEENIAFRFFSLILSENANCYAPKFAGQVVRLKQTPRSSITSALHDHWSADLLTLAFCSLCGSWVFRSENCERVVAQGEEPIITSRRSEGLRASMNFRGAMAYGKIMLEHLQFDLIVLVTVIWVCCSNLSLISWYGNAGSWRVCWESKT